MPAQLLTVSQLNEYLRMSMESDPVLADVWVRGELSKFTHHQSGHFYFALKDEEAVVSAVMFRSYAARVGFLPESGMKVLVHGRVSVFPRDGKYQIYVEEMQPDGMGALYLALEQLRKKLAAEGLFDEERKRPLPQMPERIGVVTSPTGAAVHDMIRILGRRFPAATVYLYPALVQGAGAAASVAEGIRFFNERWPVDVLIVGRGGGSAEDLFCFNDEALVRAVAASAIPVISAVGHDTDVTLCDFAADRSAPTPSAAAEAAVPDVVELRRQLSDERLLMISALTRRIKESRATLALLSSKKVLQDPRTYLQNQRMQVAFLENKLQNDIDATVREGRSALSAFAGKLSALDPLRVLARGFAAVFDENKQSVDSVKSVRAGDRVHIRFADGVADATVTATRESE